MSFSTIKLLNESFSKQSNVSEHEEAPIQISKALVEQKIIQCKQKLKSLKEQYDEIKSNYQSICNDTEVLALSKKLNGGLIAESFNKAIEQLKMEYTDAKATLDYYKELKNNTLLEADMTLDKDAIFDPQKPINFRAIAKARDDLAKQKAQDEERQLKKAELREKAAEIAQKIEDAEDPFEEAFDLLVPSSGPAQTVAGEKIRAMMKIMYRDFNDGDLFYQGYGLETCGAPATYLMENGYWDEFDRILNQELRDDDYTEALEEIKNQLVDDILTSGELSEINEDDMYSYNTSWLKENQPRYDFEVYVDNDVLEQHIEKGNCDAWKLKDYVENVLSYENELREAEVETPWSKYDTSLTINNLTKDGLERLEDIFMNNGASRFWEDLVAELNDEYGDPFEDDDDDESDYDDVESEEVEECMHPVNEEINTNCEVNPDVEKFLDAYEKLSDMNIKRRVDKILMNYDSSYDIKVGFCKASKNDQARMLELVS